MWLSLLMQQQLKACFVVNLRFLDVPNGARSSPGTLCAAVSTQRHPVVHGFSSRCMYSWLYWWQHMKYGPALQQLLLCGVHNVFCLRLFQTSVWLCVCCPAAVAPLFVHEMAHEMVRMYQCCSGSAGSAVQGWRRHAEADDCGQSPALHDEAQHAHVCLCSIACSPADLVVSSELAGRTVFRYGVSFVKPRFMACQTCLRVLFYLPIMRGPDGCACH
jgi:hypothetical protein